MHAYECIERNDADEFAALVNSLDNDQKGLLFLHAVKRNNRACCRILKKSGFNSSITGIDKTTIMTTAIRMNNPEFLSFLLFDIDMDITEDGYKKNIEYLIEEEQVDSIEMLNTKHRSLYLEKSIDTFRHCLFTSMYMKKLQCVRFFLMRSREVGPLPKDQAPLKIVTS